MKFSKLTLLLGPLVIALTGCVQSHRQPAAAYTTPGTVPAPTSERPAVRVYPGSAAPTVVTPPSSPPPGVAPADVVIAESVSHLLKSEVSLAQASRNVRATVDHGVVTLQGTVPANHDRDEMVERIGQLPGVRAVHDELSVEYR